MRSNAPSNAISNGASPANASSTPIAVSASTPSRRPFMGSFRYRDDQPHEEPAVTLDAFLEQPDATAVRLEAGEGARRLLPYLDRLQLIDVSFPRFGDGRGFSRARTLSESRYKGDPRATGERMLET